MLILIDDENIKVAIIERESAYVTLCFTGIGHAFGGINVQSEEFIKSAQTSTSIFIVDKKRSWGNNIDFDALRDAIAPYCHRRTINALGNSMGGFLAILASKFFDISTSIAFVPQFSVSKNILPDESRWDEYVLEIHNWRHESLADAFNQTTKYYLIAGLGGDDEKHLDLMPVAGNIHKIYFRNPRFDHDIANALKNEGVLYRIIEDCFSHKKPLAIIESHLRDKDCLALVAP